MHVAGGEMSDELKFPATGMSHGPSGATPTCDRHAGMFSALFGFMGGHTNRTVLTEPMECTNCLNEAKAKA